MPSLTDSPLRRRAWATVLFLAAGLLASFGAPREIVFIDGSLPDVDVLVEAARPGVETVLLDPARDPIGQITAELHQRRNLNAVHIVSHGAPGAIMLNRQRIDVVHAAARRAELATWRTSLARDAEILLYGCEIGRTAAGADLVAAFAQETGATVRASTNQTGRSALGGDWLLEMDTGSRRSAGWFAADRISRYDHLLATLNAGDIAVVGWNSFTDTVTFVTLVSIPAGTVIKITDKGWYQATPAFTTSATADGVVTWTLSSPVSAGTVLRLVLGGSDNSPATALTNLTTSADLTGDIAVSGFSTSDPWGTAGDQILIYQDADTNPFFIFGFNNSSGTLDSDGWNTSITITAVSVRDSMLPNGTGSQNALTNGTTAIGITPAQLDNVQFTAPTSAGDRANWLSRIADVANWSGDNDGSTASSIGTSISVTVPDTVPSLAATGGNPTFTEGGGAADLFNTVTAATNNSPAQTFIGATLTVTNVSDASSEVLSIGGTSVALTNGNAGVLTGIGNYSVSVSGGTATVTLSGMTRTDAQMGTLVDGMTYSNSSEVPTAGGRVVTITGIVDSGATNNTTATSLGSTVTVAAVNDAPAFTGLNGTPGFTEGGAAVTLDADVTVSDPELAAAGAYTGATLTIARNGGANASDSFSLNPSGALFTVSGGNLQSSALTFATFTNSGGTLTISFTSSGTNATPALVNDVLQRIQYQNTSDAPPASAQLSWTFADGNSGAQGSGGALAASGSTTVSITAVNDNPTITLASSPLTITEDTASSIAFGGGSFADVDSASVSVTVAMTLTSGGMASGSFSLAADGSLSLSGNLQPSFTATGSPANVANYLGQPTNFTYTPATDVNGTGVLTLTVSANDNNGFNGSLGTITVDVTAANDAPSITGGGTLTAVNEDTASPAGAALNTLGITATDVDGGSSVAGYAIVGNTANSGTQGSWQYSTNAGANWFAIGTVADDATALALSSATLVRFVPVGNFSGAPASLTFRALDNTYAGGFSTTAGSETRTTVNTGTNGGTTAISANTGTIATSITAVNDAPTLTATGLSPTFGEGGAAVDLFGTVSASTVDSGQTFAALTLTVTNVSNGANEILAIGGTDVALTNGNSGTLTGVGSYSVSVSGGTATVSATGMTRDNTQMGTLVDGITYRNTATPPGSTARVVTLTGIQDSGGTANSGVDATTLSLASTVSIDLAPTITGRAVSSNGTYKTGQNLDFTVTYSENVTVNTGGGTPSIVLTLDTGGGVNAAYNAGASTATTLTFRYTVASGNADTDGIAVASSISLNGGTIKDSANTNAPTTSLGFGSTTSVLVDGIAPTVSTSNRQNPSGASTNATSVVYRVTFAEAVTGVDTADFTLTKTGTADGSIASVDAVSGTVYDVTVNTITGFGTLRLDLNGSGTGIADTPATNAIATGYTSGQTYSVDTVAPAVTSVAVPGNATYVSGQNLDFTVNWDENVTVNTGGGTPSIALMVGATSRSAAYVSGSGTTALVFRYQTQSGDLDTDGIAVGALSLNGGTLKDAAGNNATLTLNSVGSTANVNVDAVAPTVTGRTVPTNATYKTGQNLDFTVTYSENVTVNTGGGTPSIAVALDTGGSVQAAYNGGTGTSTLTFRYTVASGNLDADGIAVTAAIALNGGTIKDAIGNDAQVTGLGFGATTGVLVDGVAPTVSSSNRQTPSGASTNATSVVFRVTFAEAISGVDAADFTVTKTGTADGTVASVNAVSSTVYDVTVNTITGNGTLRLDLNNAGTAITDTPGNAIATGYTSGQTYTIDSTAPTLSTIARQSPATVHTAAASATWRVTFAEGVTGVDTADFTLTQVSGTGSGTIASVTPVSTSVYDVVVNSLSGQARLRLDLKATGTGIADLAGNAMADGGFTTGEFYLVGVTSVFESLNLTVAANVTTSLASTNKPAQRFTTAAGQPLTLSSVVVKLNSVTATPTPVVKIYTDNAGAPGTAVGTALTNPASLTPNALNVWTGSVLLSASTTYWIVFEETVSSYAIDVATLTTGGTGDWLTNPDYLFRYGTNSGTTQTGAILLALGATSVPSITSTLTASATYASAFNYTITATNTPTSFAATGLPSGLSLNSTTGVISGSPSQTGSFNVSLTASNGSGTSSPSTLVLTVSSASASVVLGSLTRTYTGSPLAVTATTSPGGLSVTITYNGSPTPPTDVGTYSVVAAISSSGYSGSISGTLTVAKATATVVLGQLAHTFDGTGQGATATTTPAGLTVTLTYDGSATPPSAIGSYTVVATVSNANYSGTVTGTLTIAPAVVEPPVPLPGSTVVLSATGVNAGQTGQWQRNGTGLAGATSPTLTLPDVQPPTAGLYTYTATVPGGTGTSEPVIVGLATTEKVIGTGELVGSNLVHPNGNVYDQVLLDGTGAAITASPAKVTRLSFVDLTNDIVQVEFSGAGTLSVVMDDASSPTPAANYNQPGVDYVRGHVGLVITGANETSNLTVFSVGPVTAVNQALFKPDVTYDGVADLAFIAIQSTDGKFGGVRTGNVHYFASQGFTGVYAPGVTFSGAVNIGEVTAFDSASPVLIFGSAGEVHITGGNLLQSNGQPVKVSGITQLRFVTGTTSQGATLPAQANQGRLVEDGVDVTNLIVVNP